MAVRPIHITGEPVLHTRAKSVGNIDDEVRELVRDMEETMDAAPGVGLAAPQVGVALRIFIWNWHDDDGAEHSGTAINPELWISPTPTGEPEEGEAEGCLSVPGERFALRRAELAHLRATGLDGRPFEVKASGWLARILQHEYDHLDGILYTDRLSHALSRLADKAIKKQSWGSPGAFWIPGQDHLED